MFYIEHVCSRICRQVRHQVDLLDLVGKGGMIKFRSRNYLSMYIVRYECYLLFSVGSFVLGLYKVRKKNNEKNKKTKRKTNKQRKKNSEAVATELKAYT